MQSQVSAAALYGIKAVPVIVETDVSRGLPFTKIIGLGDTTVKEAASRIRSAIVASGFEYPMSRVTINLSPAWLHKRGSHLDLSMAIGILSTSSLFSNSELKGAGFLGELSLNGKLRPCQGILPMVEALKECGSKRIFLPKENEKEANLVCGVEIIGIKSLAELVDLLRGQIIKRVNTSKGSSFIQKNDKENPDFKDIKGQEEAKRAISVAVSGGHNLMMIGTPGTGKTMVAERLPFIMPTLSEKEILELTGIYSVAGLLSESYPVVTTRPFRRPQIMITKAGMLGSGYPPRPGEITLAHRGVLFLDEFTEMDRSVVESLRVPLDNKKINLVKRGKNFIYPADFMLVLSANPCKCGYYGDDKHECTCTSYEIARYRAKLSGPLNDRIDIHISLRDPGYNDLLHSQSTSSAEMREEIMKSREVQAQRFGRNDFLNADIADRDIVKYCRLDSASEKLAQQAYDSLKLNPRTLMKIKKVARTIADMAGSKEINHEHFAEALMYRERAVRR